MWSRLLKLAHHCFVAPDFRREDRDGRPAHCGSYAIGGIEPLLSVRRGAHAINFYVSAFSARVIMRVDAENGDVVARLTVANATFWAANVLSFDV